ncbi:uncharacterized protein RSE6_07335 [Rhynchosporium secalis]|uniref:Uncharacterized protein n=1 Tax=Rhynchosporium secalis TaxID=38038 RepID=A0A1E1MDN4_RHYSE|nr:uncharacterized protein RSE6_07335 [Rhynchosporium secalis]
MNQGDFKYEWVTKIVEGGNDWQLVNGGPKAGKLSLSQWNKPSSEKHEQATAFKKILNAMYTLPYAISNAAELFTITNLARFYMCLPLVSGTLDGPLALAQDWTMKQLWQTPEKLLQLSIELRHKNLFHDVLMFSLGPFSRPVFFDWDDQELKKILMPHHKLRSRAFGALEQTIILVLDDYQQ